MNTRAIADAVAARFTGITATVGGETRTLASTPTALLPNQIAVGPVVLVYPPSGTTALETSTRRDDTDIFLVRLLVDPFDAPTRTAWLYAWYDAMRDRVEMNYDLDLSYVAFAKTEGPFRIELDGITYGGVPFDVVELTIEVRVREPIATVAV